MAKKLLATLENATGAEVNFYDDDNALEIVDPAAGVLRYVGNLSEHSGQVVKFSTRQHANGIWSFSVHDPGTTPADRTYYGSNDDVKKVAE